MSNIVESLYNVTNNTLIEATMTPEEKMTAWHNGERRENIKACSDKKLLLYYDICVENHYGIERQRIANELVNRGYTFDSFTGQPEKPTASTQGLKSNPKELTAKFKDNVLYILSNAAGKKFLNKFYDNVDYLPTAVFEDSIYYIVKQDFQFANDIAKALIKELNL